MTSITSNARRTSSAPGSTCLASIASAGHLKAALAGTTALVAIALIGSLAFVGGTTSALAQGGSGGSGNLPGFNAAGGTDSSTGTGNPGAAPCTLCYNAGGGGGGAGFNGSGGAGGGMGGAGANDTGETSGGGAGGSTAGSGPYGGGTGQTGGHGSLGGGGGGGGGGEHGFVSGTLPTMNVTGGNGGYGGDGSSHFAYISGAGGGGGAGGYGAVVTGSGPLGELNFNIKGGTGGNGGNGGSTAPGPGNGGNAATGGLGFLLLGNSEVRIGASTISGGTGGDGGNGGGSPFADFDGNGGNAGTGGTGLQQVGTSTVTIDASAKIYGGNGGLGGASGGATITAHFASPGNGGAGGIGASVNNGTLVNLGTITGGVGGNTGNVCTAPECNPAPAGNGGNGVSVNGGTLINNGGTITGGVPGFGAGVAVGGTGVSINSGIVINNGGTITGGSTEANSNGAGGSGATVTNGTLINNGGTIMGGSATFRDRAGGYGVSVTNGIVVNGGTIAGGFGGDSGPQNNPIVFGSGTNKLELWSGSVISGNVIANTGGADTLALGGTAAGTFNVSAIGGQYQGFETFEKTGTSTWTLTGTPNAATPWAINQGTLSISQDASLGSGGISFDGGGLLNTSSFTTGRTIILAARGGTFITAADLTVTRGISGPGGLTKVGPATLTLTADNPYSGGTAILQGTLQVGSGGTSGSIVGNVVDHGTLAFNRSDNVTFGGTVSGSGALAQLGAGILTLTANNTYSGNTIVAAGSLEVGNGGTTGSIVGDVLNNGSLAFNRADTLVYGGAISGNGVFTKAGAGTLTLSGNSTYTGNTIVAAGALNIVGSLGQTAVSVAGGASLFGSGSISGPVTVQNGGILSGGGGTLALGALTLQAGATTNVLINGPGFVPFNVAGDFTAAGTLNVVTTGGYGRGVYHVVEYGGTFVNNGIALGTTPPGFITEINTESAQQLNIKVYDDPTATQFWRGDANPVGGNGTWSSTNTNWRNADSRATTVWGGVQAIFHGTPGTVTIEGTQAFQSMEFVVSGYTLVAGNAGVLAPTGMAQLWAEGSRTTATIAAPIIGPGGIEKIGVGTIVLAAANSYSGGTTITAGTLSISADANLGAASGGLTFNGGTLENTAALTTARAITFNGTGTLKTSADLTVTGVISGAGGLTKAGPGRLTLTGNNTYAGGTILHAGTVSVSADANLGAASGGLVFHGGTLENSAAFTTARTVTLAANGGVFNTTADLTASGAIAGPGALAKTGAGTLTLTANNSYTGGTIIGQGTLRIGDGGTAGSIVGDVVNQGTLVVDRAGEFTLGGVIAGSGGLIKTGTGRLTLLGENFYIGGTTIAQGTLRIGDGGTAGSFFGDVTNNGVLAFDHSDDLGYGGTVAGSGQLHKFGAGRLTLAGNNSYTGSTIINSGMLSVSADANLGAVSSDLVINGGALENTATFAMARNITLAADGTFLTTADLTVGGTISGPGRLTKAGAGRLTLVGTNSYSGDTTIAAGTLRIGDGGRSGSIAGNVVNHGVLAFDRADDLTFPGAVSGSGAFAKFGFGQVTLTANNTYSGGTFIGAGALRIGDGRTSGSITGDVVTHGTLAFDRADEFAYGGTVSGSGGLAKLGTGTLILTANNTYTGGTTVHAGTLQIGNGGMGGSIVGDITNNGALVVDSAANFALAGIIAGSGALTKIGSGTLMLGGTNSYAGGTTVNQGTLAISSDGNLGAPSGGLTLNGGELLPTASFTTQRAITLGPGGGSFFAPGGVTLSASGVIAGPGALTLAGGGTLSLGGINTYTGATTVNAGALVVNGSIAASSLLSVGPTGSVGGTGTLPSTTINGGTLAPGNSIGTLTVQGNFTQNGGAYQVELSPTGADRANVSGTATINGGTVQLFAQPGSYANSTTYTLVNATGGVTGTYNPNVTEDFAFLTPSLSYDVNNVFLTLALLQGAFSFGGNTPNEKAVGYALDRSFASASGDFATVINALAGLSTAQGAQALNTISGQPWANFGSMNVATGAMFMNSVGQQMALARGAAAAGQRVALAEACDVASCDGPGPWSAWLSAVGGLGSVQGNRNASTFTYNAGGAAAGLDYRVDPRFLVGLSVGYTHGTQWTNGFTGQGWSDTVSVAVYGSFAQGGFYVDALAGFARSTNQLQRQIVFPNLQPRTANGSAGANQFLGQAEAGYRFGIYAPAQASLTPFVRVGVQSVTQNAFSESGANALSLNVAQQGTNSLRSTIGAELAGELPLGSESKLALALRLGWLHEYDDTSRPISAAFAGAPGNGFTVYGATPARDSAVLGFQASTSIAEATSVYLRYDGEVGGGTDNHAINLGLRVSW